MSAVEHSVALGDAVLLTEVAPVLDDRTNRILEHRRTTAVIHRRGWLVRRTLLIADVVGLAAGFVVAQAIVEKQALGPRTFDLVFALTLPAWIVLAKLCGLYDRDEERTDHSTIDEGASVFQFLTTGAWLLFLGEWAVGYQQPEHTIIFWGCALALVTVGRMTSRAWCHRSLAYLQNTLIVGAGDVGQLVARKLLHHPEYGINLVGFVDAQPKERRADLEHLTLLGPPERLPALVRIFDIERVVIAFSNDSHAEVLGLVRTLKELNVQIDIVPRLFEVVGPNVGVHSVEGLPLVGLPPSRISRSSHLLKRTIDIVGAAVGLVVTAPLFAYIALRVKRDSPGPVFFRQARLGLNQREFPVLKFRTMKVDTEPDAHREYVKSLMGNGVAPTENGLFKLSQDDSVTPFGRWLRKTSLDELPQLVNVLRGQMSLVGPRPCIPYETEDFELHHFERFLVPAGITGLWQVTGRAHMTFRESLEMDVVYARGWTLGLDLNLLLRTVRLVLGRRTTT